MLRYSFSLLFSGEVESVSRVKTFRPVRSARSRCSSASTRRGGSAPACWISPTCSIRTRSIQTCHFVLNASAFRAERFPLDRCGTTIHNVQPKVNDSQTLKSVAKLFGPSSHNLGHGESLVRSSVFVTETLLSNRILLRRVPRWVGCLFCTRPTLIFCGAVLPGKSVDLYSRIGPCKPGNSAYPHLDMILSIHLATVSSQFPAQRIKAPDAGAVRSSSSSSCRS
jgi:hypothetical protein